jgi:hypothetical protein
MLPRRLADPTSKRNVSRRRQAGSSLAMKGNAVGILEAAL